MKAKEYCPDCDSRLDPIGFDEESGIYVCVECGWKGIVE